MQAAKGDDGYVEMLILSMERRFILSSSAMHKGEIPALESPSWHWASPKFADTCELRSK
jgi:hypothetical protein